MKKSTLVLLVIGLVLFIDQLTKLYIKTHFTLYQDVEVFPWFHILFIENNGMAFGMELFGKLFLSLFRIVAVGIIGYYLYRLVRREEVSVGYLVCISLICAGAAGNIIDSLLYGLIFTESTWDTVAHIVPLGEGYAPLFYGKVVDMLYFPLFSFCWYDWIPVIGGQHFEFFRPIFNVADSSITVGVFLLLIFYRKHLDVTPPVEAHA